jgi:hypothetical protein
VKENLLRGFPGLKEIISPIIQMSSLKYGLMKECFGGLVNEAAIFEGTAVPVL